METTSTNKSTTDELDQAEAAFTEIRAAYIESVGHIQVRVELSEISLARDTGRGVEYWRLSHDRLPDDAWAPMWGPMIKRFVIDDLTHALTAIEPRFDLREAPADIRLQSAARLWDLRAEVLAAYPIAVALRLRDEAAKWSALRDASHDAARTRA